MKDGSYSKEAFQNAFDELYIRLTNDILPVSDPQGIILGGQSGAGKTILQRMMSQNLDHNLVILNGDEFRRYHPDFRWFQEMYGKDSVNYTNAFSGQMTEALIDRLKEEGYNILVEGTLRTTEVPTKTCLSFRESGYSTTLAIMAVKPEISYISTIKRYEDMLALGETPRATPKAIHDKIVQNLPDNIQTLKESGIFDNISIYNRRRECLYDMHTSDVSPKEVMTEVLNGKWSVNDIDQFCAIGDYIVCLMEERDAPELSKFKEKFYNPEIVKAVIQENGLPRTKYPLEDYGIKAIAGMPKHTGKQQGFSLE